MEDSAKNEITPYSLRPMGVLKGHSKEVTKICVTPNDPNSLISASRDKSILVWQIYNNGVELDGKLKKSLIGHNHFVSDCSLSKDGGFLISSSWDTTLRLWDLNRGVVKRTFIGHKQDVTSVSFSMDNRQIVSASRDRTIRLWNTLAVQKFVFDDLGHQDCVSSVLTSPQTAALCIYSGGWDGLVKMWTINPAKCHRTFYGHSGPINSMSINPPGDLLASGSNDFTVNLWNLKENKFVKKFETNGPVTSVAFNPRQFLLAVGVNDSIRLYDGESTNPSIIRTTTDHGLKKSKNSPRVSCITWSNDGLCLYVGYTDASIRIFALDQNQHN